VNEWLLAAVVLAALLAPLAVACSRLEPMEGVVALELAGVIAPLVLLLMAEGFHRQPFADLALVLAFLSFAGSLAYARFLERRL
jgi:multisubunit Na+/H+ antiporter MnhF subunit